MAIFKQSKPSFWSLTGRRDTVVEDELEQTPDDVSSRLGDLMGQLDAGIAQSTEREKVIQAGRRRQAAEADPLNVAAAEPVQPAAEAAPVKLAAAPAPAKPAAAPVPSKPVLAAVADPVIEPEALEDDPEADEALRAIAEQRKAAEALLVEACVLEERIKKEAATAKIVRAYEAAENKAETASARAQAAAVAEEEATQRAGSTLRDHAVLANELKGIEDLLAGKRTEADAAKAQIAALEQQLAQVKHAAETVLSDVELHESRHRECLARETAAARAAAETAARIAARKAEREAAEAEVVAARERAAGLKAQLPSAPESDSMENVARLKARIAEQLQLSRKSHNGTVTAA